MKVISGKELLHQNLISEPLVDLEEDQFLTCIGGIQAKFFNDGEMHELLLEKIL